MEFIIFLYKLHRALISFRTAPQSVMPFPERTRCTKPPITHILLPPGCARTYTSHTIQALNPSSLPPALPCHVHPTGHPRNNQKVQLLPPDSASLARLSAQPCSVYPHSLAQLPTPPTCLPGQRLQDKATSTPAHPPRITGQIYPFPTQATSTTTSTW